MDNRDYLILLYDFYSELFTDKQKEYFESYYFDNLSLSEIANNLGVSRNTIHKVVQAVEEKLRFYEEKLKLYQTNQIIYDIIKNDNTIEVIKKKLEGIGRGDEIRG